MNGLVGFVLFVSVAVAHATELKVTDTVALTNLDVIDKMGYPAHCTGFVRTEAGKPQNRIFTTAEHCLANAMFAGPVAIPFKEFLTIIKEGKALPPSTEQISIQRFLDFDHGVQDIVSANIKAGEMTYARTFPTAQAPLQYREQLALAGWSAVSPAGYVYSRCVYLGAMLVDFDRNGERVWRVTRKMFCPFAPPPNFVNGASGGPVVNARGEVVGVATKASDQFIGVMTFDDLQTRLAANQTYRFADGVAAYANTEFEFVVKTGEFGQIVQVTAKRGAKSVVLDIPADGKVIRGNVVPAKVAEALDLIVGPAWRQPKTP